MAGCLSDSSLCQVILPLRAPHCIFIHQWLGIVQSCNPSHALACGVGDQPNVYLFWGVIVAVAWTSRMTSLVFHTRPLRGRYVTPVYESADQVRSTTAGVARWGWSRSFATHSKRNLCAVDSTLPSIRPSSVAMGPLQEEAWWNPWHCLRGIGRHYVPPRTTIERHQ